MKNFILFCAFMFLFAAPAFAAKTIYVRDDGGDNSQCTGLTYAKYPGSGTAQPCSFKHPRYALGWGCTYTGTACQRAGNMVSGDTLMIDGMHYINGVAQSSQAQYMVGYDTSGLTPGCNAAFPWDCTLGKVPTGISAAAMTKVLGIGYDTVTGFKPQLWGNERVDVVLSAFSDNIDIEYLEITDHSSCITFGPQDGTVDGFPVKCQRDSAPFGPWAGDGIYTGGDNIVFRNLDVHGLGHYGINLDQVHNATFDTVLIEGNGWAGLTTGTSSTVTGLLNWNKPQVNFNGCGEHYPRFTSTPDSITNFHHCWGQLQGGYGDGIAFGNVGSGNAGSWTFTGPGSISHNTSDGLDTLHGQGTGTIKVTRIRAEGNAGNQLKINAHDTFVENNLILGDCGWWKNNAVTSPKDSSGNTFAFGLGDICRANGDTLLVFLQTGSTANIYNNTIIGNGFYNILSKGDSCDGTTQLHIKNNISYGGKSWIDDPANNPTGGGKTSNFYFSGGNNGDGGGSCGSVVPDEDYNMNFGSTSSGCSGTHSKCSTDPQFTGTFAVGPTTFYSGTALASLVYLQSTSQAVNAGVGSLSYQFGSNDANNFVRSVPFDMGALELGSTTGGSTLSPDGATCTAGLQCNSGLCCYAVCGSTACQSNPATILENFTLNGSLGR